jgi:O-antigen/teichoic acid export membrane protein
MAPVLTVRLASIPLVVVAMAGLLRVVRVDLDSGTFLWTSLWIAAGQVGTFVYAVVRVDGRTAIESISSVVVRLAQAGALVVAAMAGWSATGVIGSLALLELTLAVGLLAGVGLRPTGRFADVTALPWRELAAFTLLEIVGFMYLRTDTVLVGRLLDSTSGATYTLLYRVIDAAVAVVTPLVMVLYPQAALRAAAGESLERYRRVGLGLVPTVGVVAAAVGALLAQPLLDLVPRYDDHAVVLRCLLAAVPLMTWNAIELHLRAAEGATRAVVRVGLLTFIVAIVVSVPLIDRWGLRGAALGVVVAEATQLLLLLRRMDMADRRAAVWVLASSSILALVSWHAASVNVWWIGPALLIGLGTHRAAAHRGGLR